MSDTPRTEAHIECSRRDPDVSGCDKTLCFARTLERELNAANAEIERLTNKVAQLYEGAEEAKQRIKRLEEAGDLLTRMVCRQDGYGSYQDEEDAVNSWLKAKEDKP
jgi:predicted  nucleic acid-binding Zn-ribbon protein